MHIKIAISNNILHLEEMTDNGLDKLKTLISFEENRRVVCRSIAKAKDELFEAEKENRTKWDRENDKDIING